MKAFLYSLLTAVFLINSNIALAATLADYAQLPEREKVSISSWTVTRWYFNKTKTENALRVLFDIENRTMLKAFDLQQLKAKTPYFLTNNKVIFNVSEVTRIAGKKSREYSMAHNYDIKADKLRTTLVLGEGIYLNQTGLGKIIGVSADEKYAYMPAFTDSGSIGDRHAEYSVMRVSPK